MNVDSKRLSSIYWGIHTRCTNPKSAIFGYYGGRGILNEFRDLSSFSVWAIANGYAAHLECDRRDNNGNYSPENCRWITHAENSINRRPRKFLLVLASGEHLKRACERLGVSYNVAQKRVSSLGYTPDEAVLPYADFLVLSRDRRRQRLGGDLVIEPDG